MTSLRLLLALTLPAALSAARTKPDAILVDSILAGSKEYEVKKE